MPRKKKESVFPDYIRVRYPDTEVLAMLTKKAIGKKRSAAEFAEACGLSKSTISRIINEKFTTPVSDGVIAAIAKNADPESGVSLKDLLAAHGLIPVILVNEGKAIPLDESKGPKKPPRPDANNTSSYKAIVDVNSSALSRAVATILASSIEDNLLPHRFREIIQSALLEKGYTLELHQDIDIVKMPQFRYKVPFAFTTNAVEVDGLHMWAFDIHDDVRFSLYQKISWIFGTAYIESPRQNGIKISLVTMDKDQFMEAKEKFKDIEITDCISIILIDITNKCVVEEFRIKQNNALAPLISVFSNAEDFFQFKG